MFQMLLFGDTSATIIVCRSPRVFCRLRDYCWRSPKVCVGNHKYLLKPDGVFVSAVEYLLEPGRVFIFRRSISLNPTGYFLAGVVFVSICSAQSFGRSML